MTKPAGPIANGLTPAVPGRVPVGGTPTVLADPKPVTATKEKETVPAAREPVPLVSRPTAAVAATVPTPVAPTTNSNGQFSLARQLGLGISRIVLDAGHGGHDPGARSNGIEEAELVLDVTLRLRDLLEKQPGIEVTLTRDTDEFIPLEERTAIANRNGADLFLSIHANASRNPKARGIETYFLNFASNPEAEAVAARENSASGQTMHSLPEIVRAIALNNKIDESRDFADMVQKSMVRRLSTRNKLVRDLGVKQAPFVVLIGAGMPSVLAEISFVTNKQEGGSAQDAGVPPADRRVAVRRGRAVPAIVEGREGGGGERIIRRDREVTEVTDLKNGATEGTKETKRSVTCRNLAPLSQGVDDEGVTRSASESGRARGRTWRAAS